MEDKTVDSHSSTHTDDVIGNDNNYIDKLPDELLLEILRRVPTYETAVRCKCVSKRWLNLISYPFSISPFSPHKSITNHTNSPPFALLFNDQTRESKAGSLLYYSKDHADEFGCCGFSFKFLPRYHTNEQGEQIPVEGFVEDVHGDLILLWMRKRTMSPTEGLVRNYVICNPRTMQWVQLPPLSTVDFYYNKVVILCDPFICSFNTGRGKSCLNGTCRYKVIYIHHDDEYRLQFDVFNSETGRWGKMQVFPDVQGGFTSGRSVVHNGMVHLCNSSKIVAFDPFTSDQIGVVVASCRIIDLPVYSIGGEYPRRTLHFGLCSGRLRVSLPEKYGNSFFIKVWDLEDYDKGEWCLKHEIYLKDIKEALYKDEWCIKHKVSAKEIRVSLNDLRVLGFHPFEDILYLQIYLSTGNQVAEFNMREKTLEAMQVMKNTTSSIISEDAHIIRLPWWPTPIPMLK